jgi:hypothetical protein
MTWVNTLANGQDKRNAVNNILSTWASSDVNSALAYAKQLPEGQAKQQALVGISQQWAQQDPKAAMDFATGLPAGLVIGSSTGRITGTPTTAGNFNVTVTARDALSAASQPFTWSVVLRDTTAPTQPASFAASAASGNPTLTWGASTDNVGVTGYVIYRSTDGTQGAEVARTPASMLQWVDPAFQQNLLYTYSM